MRLFAYIFASIESFLIFLLIAAGSAFFNWLKKRGEKTEDWSNEENRPGTPVDRDYPAPPPLAPRREPTTNWEEELRRMLEGGSSQETPPPVQVPRPAPVYRPVPPPIATVKRTVTPVFVQEEEGPAIEPPSLAKAKVGYERASHIEDNVASHFKHMAQHPVALTSTGFHMNRTPEIDRARTFLKNRASIREALIASIILSPPKALENSNGPV